jgi:hypothetical protein
LLCLSLFYSIDMIELLLPCGFDTLEYSWVKATIGICMPIDYSVAKKRQHSPPFIHHFYLPLFHSMFTSSLHNIKLEISK